MIKLYLSLLTRLKYNNHKQNSIDELFILVISKNLQQINIKTEDQLKLVLLYNDVLLNLLKNNMIFCPELFLTFEKILQYKAIENPKILKNSAHVSLPKYLFDELVRNSFGEEETSEDDNENKWKVCWKQLNLLLNMSKSDPNCDLLFKGLHQKLATMKANETKYIDHTIVNKIMKIEQDTKIKSLLDIQKDKPLIRIKQLTPRFDDSGDDEEKVRVETKRLKKTVKKTEKKAMKDLKNDSMALQLQKDQERKNMMEKKDINYKRLITLAEEQQIELKKMATSQVNSKRDPKRKSKRMAGNKTDDRVMKKVKHE